MKTLNSTELDHRFSRKPLVRALALSLGMGLAGSVSAATPYVVTNTDDSGAGSLRKAIIDANNNAGPDTIDLSSVSGTIILTSQLEISDDLTINGPGATHLTVSGNDNSRVFYITKTHLGAADSVEINGITISGGNASRGGGGIRSYAHNLTIQDSVVTGNKSDNSGGGIYQGTAYSQLTIRNSTISDNYSASSGGGLVLWGYRGSALIEDSTISGNNAAYHAGGIYLGDSHIPLTIVRTTISDNHANRLNCGGIRSFGWDFDLTITDSQITNNHAAGNAGGICFGKDHGSLKITGTTISGNIAHNGSGGGLYVYVEDYNPDILIQNSTISNNESNESGGGIGVYLDSVSQSNAQIGGMVIENTTISGNTSHNGDGGGLWVHGKQDAIQVTIQDSAIADNTADDSGGGIAFFDDYGYAGMDISGTTVSGNTATNGDGGGLFVEFESNGSTVTVVNSTFSNNHADNGYGGGIEFFSFLDVQGVPYGSLTVENTTIAGNTASEGGGLHIHDQYGLSTTTVENSIIAGNTASSRANDLDNNNTTLAMSFTLVGDSAGDSADMGDGITTDGGGNLFDQDPKLGALADNGGPTLTHLPDSTSPAVEAGNPVFTGPPTTDQRGTGYARVLSSAVDMGAVEVEPPTVTLGLSDSPFAENAGVARVTATLSKTWPVDVTVDLGFTGSATGGGTDYTPSASQIIIPANSTSESITLTGVDDGTIEGDETVIVDISGVTNGTEDTTNGEQQQTATITDDDLPSVTLSFVGGTSTLAENGGSVQVQATLSETFSEDVTVTLGYTGTASGSDYTGASQIVIPANSTSESMTLTGVDDGDIEGDETVIVDITSVSNGTEDGVQRVTATITDDDLPSVTLSFVGGTSTLAENGGSVQVQATLSEAFSEDVTVTLGYTGTAGGSDYTGASQIVIPANSASESMTLTGVDDAEVEGNETVIIDITGVSNGTEDGVQQITATITDDDEAPPAAPTNVSVTPGNGALTVNFTPVSGETSYTATCKPSGGTPVTATGSGSSVTVTGLSNGVSYSCSVAVTGYSGVSDAAAPAAVAPAAPAPASAPTPVPTLGFFAQWLVSMLLGGLGVLGIRRRKKS